MSDFNQRFAELTKEFPYIRFMSAQVNADTFRVSVIGVYRKDAERDFLKDRDRITDALKQLLPPSVAVHLVATPAPTTATEIQRAVLDFFGKESVFVFSSLTLDDISVTTGDNPTVTLFVTPAVREYLEKNGLSDKLEKHLSAELFSNVAVACAEKQEDMEKIRSVLTMVTRKPKFSYERPDEGRLINPTGRTVAFGELIESSAQYICDCIQPGYTVLYGTMTDIKEREYTPKKAKDGEKRKYYTFYLDDTTGKMRCVFFPGTKSQAVSKFMADGTNIIADGNTDYDTNADDGSLQYRMRHFSLCNRADFEINKVVRLPDDDYAYVRPEPYTPLRQSSLYSGNAEPLTDEPLVVFQTLTSLPYANSFGEMIELAAVKLRDGKIEETFRSLLRPLSKLPEETRQNFGLMPSDLAGKPTFDQVVPDFYRFFDGYAVTAFPLDFHVGVLKSYLDKLHIPMPTVVDMTKYTTPAALKAARPKNTHRAFPFAEAYAKVLVNLQ